MKGRTLAGFVGGAFLAHACGGLCAETTDNPYQEIVTRNAFALKPPPPPAIMTEQPPASPVDVLLTGISTLGGTAKVLLQIAEKGPNKKPEFPPPLVEGDIQGRIEVVSIDADKGAVVIKIDGNEKTLTFEKDAPKAASATPVPASQLPRPGMPTMPGAAGTIPLPQVPSAVPGAVGAQPTPGAFGVVVGGGTPSTPASPTAVVGGVAGTVHTGVPSVSPGASSVTFAPGATLPPSLPARPLRTTGEGGSGVSVGGAPAVASPGAIPSYAPVAPGSTLTREQAMARLEEQRKALREAIEARKAAQPQPVPSVPPQ